FYGHNCSFILDRMPTARVIGTNKEKTEYTIETEVYGKGIIMWLLSQGSKIKVISPTEIVDEMKAEIKKMQKLYK
ncbi:MAG: WYL domain-containing protein, partial [Lachnospiraceae bacterium]|nr:WYL domain-containing protein [Lachnospiraceae bacterium]